MDFYTPTNDGLQIVADPEQYILKFEGQIDHMRLVCEIKIYIVLRSTAMLSTHYVLVILTCLLLYRLPKGLLMDDEFFSVD